MDAASATNQILPSNTTIPEGHISVTLPQDIPIAENLLDLDHAKKKLGEILREKKAERDTNHNYQATFNPVFISVFVFIFIGASITAGVLVVSFTAMDESGKQCIRTYKPILNQKSQYNSLTNSIGVGDFNRDGYLDMVVINYGSYTIGILFGNGDGTFQSQITYSTGISSHPYFVLVHDLNGDKQLDIIVANYGSNSLALFFGNFNGSFTRQMTYTLDNCRPMYIAAGYFNNDTALDFVVANHGTDSVGILLGSLNGTISSPTLYSTGHDSNPRSIVIGDFNNDGLQDIAVANYGTNNIVIFSGHGDGSFPQKTFYSTGLDSHPHSIVAGDFNKDNQLDIAVANTAEDNIRIFFGYGNESFSNQTPLSTGHGSHPYYLVVAYLNNDNYLDLAVANAHADNIGIFMGDEDGKFSSMKIYSTGLGSTPQCVTIGDFNNDNRTDMAVANNGSNSVGILTSNRSITYRDPIIPLTQANSGPSSIAVGDINKDNIMDLVVTNYNADNIGVRLGFGNGSFSEQITYSTGYESSPISVALAHLNNDSCLDIVVAETQADCIAIFFGYCNGTFADQITISTDSKSSPVFIAVGDFNNDNQTDIAVAKSGSNNIGVFLSYGNGTFREQIILSTGSNSGPLSIAVGDLNNDQLLDIAVANYNDHNVGILLGYGNGTFASQITYSVGTKSYPSYVYVADLNNDSRADFITLAKYRDYMLVFFGTSNGSFVNEINAYTGYVTAPSHIAVGDLNNDNILDIVIGNNNAHYLSIYRGKGQGKFFGYTMYPITGTYATTFVTLADLNNDDRLDIIVANTDSDFMAILPGYDAGLFNDMVGFSTSYALYPSSIVMKDFNRDNKIDIAVSNFVGNNIDIYFGYENGSFLINNSFSTGDQSRPQMIVSTDLNNDTILDILVANSGNNNAGLFIGYGNGSFQDMKILSTGANSRPTSLAIGDINNDHRLDIIVANTDSDNIGLVLGFDIGTFTKISPLVLSSSSSTDIYTSVAVGDVNNDNKLDIVFAESNNNTLGILLNYGNGTFASPLVYSSSLLSNPVFVTFGDFNNDSTLDIVIANSGNRNILVLLGDINGTFANTKIFSFDSDDSPTSIVVGDFNNDNKLDLVVSISGSINLALLLGLGDGTFTMEMNLSTSSGNTPSSLVVADFNHDTRLDVAFTNSYENSFTILLGNENGTITHKITYSTDPGISPISMAVGDFNNDNHSDIVIVSNSNGVVGIFLGNGDGTFKSPMNFSVGEGAQLTSVSVGDFNNDNRLDVTVAATFYNAMYALLGYGNGALTSKTVFRAIGFYNPKQVIVGEFNGDDRLDCVVVDYYRIYAFFGNANEDYLDMYTVSTGNKSSPTSVSTVDLNHDNLLDIVVTNSGTENIGIFLGIGYGFFADQAMISTGTGSQPYSLVLADFNDDGQWDVAVANYGYNSIGIFLGYGNGSFNSQKIYSTGIISKPYSPVVGDFNNDTRLDIAVANYEVNSIMILFGVGDGSFDKKLLIPMGYGSRPSFIAVADVNDDTLLDFGVTKFGLGTIEILSKIC